MANNPEVNLHYKDGCGDCGKRYVELPAPLPPVADDFDWDVRDYDGFRLFMLEELAARFPERRSWTPADMEVVLVETLSVVLDQLADMNDRVQAEAFLETARRPDTVRRMLEMIGYNPVEHIDESLLESIAKNEPHLTKEQKVEILWSYYPSLMDEAKAAGPRSIHRQQRMVTQEDYKHQLSGHPLLMASDAYSRWSGSWTSHFIVVRLINKLSLDTLLSKENIAAQAQGEEEREDEFQRFSHSLEKYYAGQEITPVIAIPGNTCRNLLQDIIQRQRMIGQEVILQDALLVGIVLSISIRIAGDYYRSEIEYAVRELLVDQSDGFFAPGYLQFGEDVVASDIIESLVTLDGIESVCINRLKRVGSAFNDQSGSGRVKLEGYEVAVLEDDVSLPERGALKVTLHGGKSG